MYIDGINHVTLRVRDLDAAERFYVDVLGLKRVGQRPGMRFYSSGRFAHELALLQDPLYHNDGHEGMAHLCFNVAGKNALQALYQRCQRLGMTTSSGVDHIIMHSFYTRDPDGHVIELGTDRPKSGWQRNPRAFAQD